MTDDTDFKSLAIKPGPRMLIPAALMAMASLAPMPHSGLMRRDRPLRTRPLMSPSRTKRNQRNAIAKASRKRNRR